MMDSSFLLKFIAEAVLAAIAGGLIVRDWTQFWQRHQHRGRSHG